MRLSSGIRRTADLERRTGLPVVLWDERLTTVEANRALEASGVDRAKKEAVIDKLAAVVILQSYMEFLRNSEEERESLRSKIRVSQLG